MLKLLHTTNFDSQELMHIGVKFVQSEENVVWLTKLCCRRYLYLLQDQLSYLWIICYLFNPLL